MGCKRSVSNQSIQFHDAKIIHNSTTKCPPVMPQITEKYTFLLFLVWVVFQLASFIGLVPINLYYFVYKSKTVNKLISPPVLVVAPVGFPANHIECPANHVKYPVNHFQWPVNFFKYPVNHFELPVNSVEYPVNYFELPVNVVERPVNPFKYPVNHF